MAVRKTKDVEAIKAFITRQSDYYRNPYGFFPEDYKRQCVYIGTTNKPQFLPEDKTGNRRFIPLRCDGSRQEVHPMQDFEATREFVRQCYAEVIASGCFDLTLDHKYQEELDAVREQSTPDDTRVGMVQEWLDNLDRKQEQFVCSRQIWDKVFAGDKERTPQSYDLRDIADIMNLQIEGWRPFTKNGKARKKKFKFYGTQRAWYRPAEEVADKVAEEVAEDFSDVKDDEELPFF